MPISTVFILTVICTFVLSIMVTNHQVHDAAERVELARIFCANQVQPVYCFEVAMQDGLATVLARTP